VGELERRKPPSVPLPFGVNLYVVPPGGVSSIVSTGVKAVGLFNRMALRTMKQLPGGAAISERIEQVETIVVEEVKNALGPSSQAILRMNGHHYPSGMSGHESRVQPGHHPGTEIAIHTVGDPFAPPLRSRMASLLERSIDADRGISEDYLYTMILQQLVPDEARILAALSDGTVYPVMDVASKSPLGGNQRMVLKNASSVGKAAGISTPDNVPAYLTRLHRLGLVEFGDEDPSLQVQYEMLSTDKIVKDATDAIEKQKRTSPRLVRRTVMISELGRKFWSATDPAAE